jgi:hypothetical protein
LELPSFAKATEGIFRQWRKMEQAKRLEFSERNLEVIEIKSNVEVRHTGCSQIDAHGDAEFAEIAAAWPKLPPEIRTALVTLLRAARK